MGREGREVWAKRVERWRDSGLTAEQFADELGINAGNLRAWSYRLKAERRRVEEARSPMKAEALTWVEVSAPTGDAEATPTPEQPLRAPATMETAEKLELVLANGMTVRLSPRFDVEALRRLLAVVG
jgi:hypothetical protein